MSLTCGGDQNYRFTSPNISKWRRWEGLHLRSLKYQPLKDSFFVRVDFLIWEEEHFLSGVKIGLTLKLEIWSWLVKLQKGYLSFFHSGNHVTYISHVNKKAFKALAGFEPTNFWQRWWDYPLSSASLIRKLNYHDFLMWLLSHGGNLSLIWLWVWTRT